MGGKERTSDVACVRLLAVAKFRTYGSTPLELHWCYVLRCQDMILKLQTYLVGCFVGVSIRCTVQCLSGGATVPRIVGKHGSFIHLQDQINNHSPFAGSINVGEKMVSAALSHSSERFIHPR